MDAWDDDARLARRCLARDQDAWRELVERHAPLVHSICTSAGLSAADADDVFQQVMLSVVRGLRRYGGCRLSTWLYRITRRRIADFMRSPQRRDVAAVDPIDELRASTRDAESRIMDADRTALLRAELRALQQPARSIMAAYYVGEVPVREIARATGLPENTVKSHLRRGRQALRRHLEVTP